MAADTIREATFCCGGGGGLLTDDLLELRVKGAQPRMQALKRVADAHGVTHMAAICASISWSATRSCWMTKKRRPRQGKEKQWTRPS